MNNEVREKALGIYSDLSYHSLDREYETPLRKIYIFSYDRGKLTVFEF